MTLACLLHHAPYKLIDGEYVCPVCQPDKYNQGGNDDKRRIMEIIKKKEIIDTAINKFRKATKECYTKGLATEMIDIEAIPKIQDELYSEFLIRR